MPSAIHYTPITLLFYRRKQDVLFFSIHHRIPIITIIKFLRRTLLGMPAVEEKGYRRLTTEEAAQYFNIARSSIIRTWWFKRESIFGDTNITKSYFMKWSALENELVKQFQAAKEKNKIVTIH
jgi:hypothetical protein